MESESVFPEFIRAISQADIKLQGATAYMMSEENNQMLCMEFCNDVDLPEHSHRAQWTVVLAGKIELSINGCREEFTRGDRYYIPEGVVHSGRIYAGYADITFFNQPDRYTFK